MDAILLLQTKYADLMEKLSQKDTSMSICDKYAQLYKALYLRQEEIEYIRLHNQHPTKNLGRIKDGLELLLFRMQREL